MLIMNKRIQQSLEYSDKKHQIIVLRGHVVNLIIGHLHGGHQLVHSIIGTGVDKPLKEVAKEMVK